MEMRYINSASRLLDRNNVNRRGLDLSEELLWISVGQRVAKLPAIKIGGLKKNSTTRSGTGDSGSSLAEQQNFFSNPTLKAGSSTAFDI